jgi:hypothetical protein
VIGAHCVNRDEDDIRRRRLRAEEERQRERAEDGQESGGLFHR